jgi:hypothetical protein
LRVIAWLIKKNYSIAKDNAITNVFIAIGNEVGMCEINELIKGELIREVLERKLSLVLLLPVHPP